jgi:putative acetyltransferase
MTTSRCNALIIVVDDLAGIEIERLLERHLEFCRFHSPPGSVHALDLPALRERDSLTFWTASRGGDLLGCIAMQELDAQHGEIKSMHTSAVARGQGIGRAMVAHVIEEARRRSYRRLSLETGTMEGFLPARRLYEEFGFRACPPFANYFEDPNSVCMTREL